MSQVQVSGDASSFPYQGCFHSFKGQVIRYQDKIESKSSYVLKLNQ